MDAADVRNLVAGFDALGVSQCLAVVRRGRLVVEKTFGFGAGWGGPAPGVAPGSGRLLETMSAAKTATAALMGVAHAQGLFDLDVPIAQYGVQRSPLANWSRNANGTDFYPLVTARHLLSQTSGVGRVRPGTAFTYDSGDFIGHLARLLDVRAGAGRTALQFARREFATPLGLPWLYDHVSRDPLNQGDTPRHPGIDFCAGGDQPMRCHDLARVGQLILNRGLWPGTGGAPRRLIDEAYIAQLFRVQNIGLPAGRPCSECRQYSLLSYVVHNNTPPTAPLCSNASDGRLLAPGLPNGTLLGLGSNSRALIVLPSEDMVVVAFGSGEGRAVCENGTAPWRRNFMQDAAPRLTRIWQLVAGAINGSRPGRAAATPSRRSPPDPAPAPPPPQSGACFCYVRPPAPRRAAQTHGPRQCGGKQAIGRCSPAASQAECEASRTNGSGIEHFCPALSRFADCFDPPVACRQAYDNAHSYVLDRNWTECPAGRSSSPGTAMRHCIYRPAAFGMCSFVANATCTHGPFFPSELQG